MHGVFSAGQVVCAAHGGSNGILETAADGGQLRATEGETTAVGKTLEIATTQI